MEKWYLDHLPPKSIVTVSSLKYFGSLIFVRKRWHRSSVLFFTHASEELVVFVVFGSSNNKRDNYTIAQIQNEWVKKNKQTNNEIGHALARDRASLDLPFDIFSDPPELTFTFEKHGENKILQDMWDAMSSACECLSKSELLRDSIQVNTRWFVSDIAAAESKMMRHTEMYIMCV